MSVVQYCIHSDDVLLHVLFVSKQTESLGRYSRLAPGGTYEVPTFTRENKRRNKGVVFGNKTKSDDDIAKALGLNILRVLKEVWQ